MPNPFPFSLTCLEASILLRPIAATPRLAAPETRWCSAWALPPPPLTAVMSAIFNFQSLLIVVLLLICTCAYIRALYPSLLDRNRTGYVGAAKAGGGGSFSGPL